jgi:D-sedoheptulose 7-phosphate isomerase
MPKPPIALVLLDVDGVLTDGTVRCSAEGHEEKSLFMRDVDALFDARRRGLRVGLVTGEETPWIDSVARRLEIALVAKGAKDKLAAVRRLAEKERIALGAVCYVGDADRDAPALAAVGLGLAPRDASAAAKDAAARVLSSPGGRGAVAEAIGLALATSGPAAPPASVRSAPVEGDAVGAIRTTIAESVAVLEQMADAIAPAIVAAADLIAHALAHGGKLLICGNGGSAADAEHMAAELVGRFERERPGLAAIALTGNGPALTALANDYGWESAFSRQIEALAKPGDAVVAISTSGRSPNVVDAARRARELGLKVVALTGAEGGELALVADVCVRVPSSRVARIQEAHALAIHAICAVVDSVVGGTGPEKEE